MLLRSDGCAVACGWNYDGQCSLPPLDKGVTYSQVSIAPKILMLTILVFGQVVTTLALLTTLCGHVLVDLVIWISQLDRVKFSWLGLGGSFLVQLLLVFVQRSIWDLRHGS